MKLLTSRTLITLCLTPLANGATSVNISGPSNGWKALEGNYDYLSDQQTGLASGDIVGINPTDPGFFTSFGDNGSTSNTDGTLAFRMRLDAAGGNKNTRISTVSRGLELMPTPMARSTSLLVLSSQAASARSGSMVPAQT